MTNGLLKSMKYYRVGCLLGMLLLRCQPPPASDTPRAAPIDTLADQPSSLEHEAARPFEDSAYFRASGTEPDWHLEISDAIVTFRSLRVGLDTLQTPHVEPSLAMDTKQYQLETAAGTLHVQIRAEECTHAMSGAPAPYQVRVTLPRGTAAEPTEVVGCGAYVPDYRLHDLWVLDSLHDTAARDLPFGRELPTLEINTREASFLGSTGCNQMRGQLFAERSVLRFTDIVTTRMACPPDHPEAEFLTALRSTTTFRLGNNRLRLSHSEGTPLVFKKID